MKLTCKVNFNPRTHKECDCRRLTNLSQIILFQSTHSQRVRHALTVHLDGLIIFQSTHSQRVRHANPNHAGKVYKFQSTHSQRVRRYLIKFMEVNIYISIHALTKSATALHLFCNISLYYFNPRTHKECDDVSKRH